MDGFIYQNILEPDTEIYKMACEFMARTELYDRSLTNARSRWDETEAFIDISPRIRKLSREYATQCRKYFTEICGGSWRPMQLEIQKHNNYTAQKWIDEYNRLNEGTTEYIGNVISKKDVNDVHVIAWMPLPKPYQPKDGEKWKI